MNEFGIPERKAGIAALCALLLAGPVAAQAPGGAAPESAAQARPVHRFVEIAISPDGARVASVEGDSPPNGYYPPLRELVIRGVREGSAATVALPCGRVPQCWPGAPAWAPDGKHLAFTLRSPGTHARSLYTVAADGSGVSKLLDFDGTLERLQYARDGRLAMLATAGANKEVGATEAGAPIAGDLAAATPEQRIAILEGGSLRFVSPPDLFVYEYDWRPDGRGFVGTAAPGDGDDHWWVAKLYAFASGGDEPRVIYAPSSIRQQLATPKVSPDGSTVAFIAGIMSDFGSTGGDIFTVPVEGGAAPDLTSGMQASATALAWGCDGHLRAKLLAGDKIELVEFGKARQAGPPKRLWSAEDSIENAGQFPSMACPSGVLAAQHESFARAPEIEVGLPGRWRDITAVNAGAALRGRVRSVWWKSDGFDVQGWLLLPETSSGRIPMVTWVHGGPAAAVTPLFSGPSLKQVLLDRGYAVFQPNPRGSYGQGERFTLANVRDFGGGDLRDILAGIDAVMRSAPIDGDRLGLTGGSYGGFMTMFAVTQTNRFKAAVAAAGISNWQSYYGENGIDAWMIPYFGASAYDDPAVYARASAINFIRNVRTPTFEYVGERDIECPAPQTQEFWHALEARSVPTSIMIYPGEGHGLRDPAHSADAERRSMAWFEKYLGGPGGAAIRSQ